MVAEFEADKDKQSASQETDVIRRIIIFGSCLPFVEVQAHMAETE